MIIQTTTQINLVLDLNQIMKVYEDASIGVRPTDIVRSYHSYLQAFIATQIEYQNWLRNNPFMEFGKWVRSHGPMKSSPNVDVELKIYVLTGLDFNKGVVNPRIGMTIELFDKLPSVIKGSRPIEIVRCGLAAGPVPGSQKQVAGDYLMIDRVLNDRSFEKNITVIFSGDADWASVYDAARQVGPGVFMSVLANEKGVIHVIKNLKYSGVLADLNRLVIPVRKYEP